MLSDLFVFIIALCMVIKGATMATRYAASLAESYRLSKYTVGFIIIAALSILPETFISIQAALSGVPSFGLGMLFGSNVADLTLIFALIIFLTGRDLKVESKILKNHAVYPYILLLPLILGLNGHYSRLEGIALILTGGIFYYLALKNGNASAAPAHNTHNRIQSSAMVAFSMAILLTGAHFTVTSATSLARYFGVSPILIGMLIVGLGTTMPEFLFSLKSAKKRDDALAVGDILGTVLADATIVVGILAAINPFFFPQNIIFITGLFMVAASFVLFRFMSSKRTLTKKEAYMLFAFWVIFVLVESIANA